MSGTQIDGKKTLLEAGRSILRDRLLQCTEEQVHVFNLMYKSVDEILLEKIPWAIEQCERSIKKNKKVLDA